MQDEVIISLYFKRAEEAITATKDKYGRLLVSLAYGILQNTEDAKECENDTYLKTWMSIPPQKPAFLRAFLAKITRNLALDAYEAKQAQKRGGGELPVILDELAEILPDQTSLSVSRDLRDELNGFLADLKPEARYLFMRRYWFGDSIEALAERSGYGLSKVKMSLSRARKQLGERLEKEGYLR